MSDNKHFETKDIGLATFLIRSGVKLISIKALNAERSSFILEPPPQELVDEWLAGGTPVMETIHTFRHLVKSAWRGQRKAWGERR